MYKRQDRDGADAMRWFLMSSPILRGGNLVVTEGGIRDGVRQVMIPLWNAWHFFALYANAAGGGKGYAATASTASTDLLDRYLLAKLREFVEAMTAQLDSYDIAAACDTCLLYTSDAADDLPCVDLGGRRIIKKKKKNTNKNNKAAATNKSLHPYH